MRSILPFGETVEGYEVPVLNEREARAGAGILLLPATVSFMISYLTHNFLFTKLFVTFFMIDFAIRLYLSPRYAPTLVLGRFFVQHQKPEYVGAAQKRFAWHIGLVLSVVMFFIIVVFEIHTKIKIAICLLCILLLFSESAFGICLGCIVYRRLKRHDLRYCPGESCEIEHKEKIQEIDRKQLASLFAVTLFMSLFAVYMIDANDRKSHDTTPMRCQSGKCGSGMLHISPTR